MAVLAEAPTLAEPVRGEPRSRYLPHRYDVHGLVSIGSQVPLRELEVFRSPMLMAGYDVEVRVGPVGDTARRRVVARGADGELVYREHLGRRGANFTIRFGTPIDIRVGPLLAHSPHVLYTNVIEALLRFLLVDRGHALIHAACLEIDGAGVLITAKTDTGKTGTVLRLVSRAGTRFLSDDMTIVDANGRAYSYPKPLTISQHTLRAVDSSELTPQQWRRLRLQSRLHSKEGRDIGMLLAERNLPIMALNSVVQLLVPPPKFPVEQLAPCQYADSVDLAALVFIERGAPASQPVAPAAALSELIANTDNAYGFPPFADLAPAVEIRGRGHDELRAAEREIVRRAIASLRAHRLRSDCFDWYRNIPPVLVGDPPAPRPSVVLPDAAPVLQVV